MRHYFDFYVYNIAQGDTAGKLLWEEIWPDSAQKILEDVFFAICSESRYINGAVKNWQMFIKKHPIANRLPKLIISDHTHQLIQDKRGFVRMARDAFWIGKFHHCYGGPAWAKICTSWLRFYDAIQTDPFSKESSFYCDRLINIVHNTGSVLDKMYPVPQLFLNAIHQTENTQHIVEFCTPKLHKWARKRLKEKWNMHFNNEDPEFVASVRVNQEKFINAREVFFIRI